VSTLSLDFPKSLTEKYRPGTIDAFVGIEDAKRQARAIISRPIPNSAYLFAGESGTGKTTMALAIAKALDAQVHHIPARQADKGGK
jgi:DNA polymerase III gamma/tau subunit